MEKTMHVNGMMCAHCEARVQKSLSELPQVVSVVADHKAGTVTLQLQTDIGDDALKAAIEDLGYVVIA